MNNNKAEIQVIRNRLLGKPLLVARCLERYNRWRRGMGVYSFSEDPMKNRECPIDSKTLGVIIDVAVPMLKTHKIETNITVTCPRFNSDCVRGR